ncbi:fec operon regulator FecR [Anatilimnocola aggregata]|uniref:Fec operon regulator FecR n=1 Tax=Anatilimnocola aggregata TaxID=2528021 RepID=A0A517Y465_9BACT|nr:FecR domain-containing protein [Anatilimnocola aggregata]QDU25051.1 fec operon regulator FecR [Anatilimnocola aggregata]
MSDERLHHLIDSLLDGQLAESDQTEFVEELRSSAEARRVYWELIEQDSLLQEVVRESTGRDLARLASDDLSIARLSQTSPSLRETPSRFKIRYSLTAGAVLLSAVIGVVFAGSFWWQNSLPTTPAPSQGSVALLHSLTGDVWLSDPQQRAEKVTSGQQFLAGDKLQVGEEGEAEVLLADGSRLILGADSVLQFPSAEGDGERRVHLERGAAEVEAAVQLPDDPLILSTEQARLVVLGTRFRLYAGDGDSRVELEEGKVQFERSSDRKSVEVTAGQYAVVVAEQESTSPLIAQPLDANWRLRQTLLRAGRQIAFSHQGSRLATADHARIKVWDVSTGELQHILRTSAWSDRLAFTPSDDAIVALSESGQALLWSVGEPAAILSELKCEHGQLRRCDVSRSGSWLVQSSSVDSGYLPVWKIEPAGTISLVRSLTMKAGSVALAEGEAGSDTPLIVVASQWNGTTVKWDASSGKELARYRFGSELHRTALSLDGRLLAGFGNADGLLLVDTETGETRKLWPPGSVRVNRLRFSADGRAVFAAMNDGVARAWSTHDGQSLLVLSTGDSHLLSLDVSTDGVWVATSGDDGAVKIWQRESPTAPETK